MFCPSRLFGAAATTAIELPHLETFPGAACCRPIDLPGYKAAPFQALIRSTRGLFAILLCSFLILQALWRFWVTRPRPRDSVAQRRPKPINSLNRELPAKNGCSRHQAGLATYRKARTDIWIYLAEDSLSAHPAHSHLVSGAEQSYRWLQPRKRVLNSLVSAPRKNVEGT